MTDAMIYYRLAWIISMLFLSGFALIWIWGKR